MYTLIRSLSVRHLVLEQLPALTASLVIAELFYKFHSFILECAAFLATWYAFDAGMGLLRKLLARRASVGIIGRSLS